MYTADFGTQDGVNLAPSPARSTERIPERRVEPGHTHRPRGRPKVRMLLSFQRPPHLFRKVAPSHGYARGRRLGPGTDPPV
jgi:hypothetical protein